jgi:hypothetical protein
LNKLSKMVEEAVEAYNRYRLPEATASIVKIEGSELVVNFQGSFCATCGLYDWLEDLIFEIQSIKFIDVKINRIERLGLDKIRVKYKLRQ